MQIQNHKIFETERLTIRPTALEDATFIFELFNSPKWLQFIGDRKIRSVENAKNYISERMHPQLQKLGFSNYTIIRKSDNLKIGTCGLYDREVLNGID
ncbi:MAG: GNAT family N-acetyltransferase, partial [Christiangramia sp.]